jgi:hypothetical protein
MTPAMQEFINDEIPRIFRDHFEILEIEPDCDTGDDVYDVHVQVRLLPYRQLDPIWLTFKVCPGIAMLNIYDDEYVEADTGEVYRHIMSEYAHRLCEKEAK